MSKKSTSPLSPGSLTVPPQLQGLFRTPGEAVTIREKAPTPPQAQEERPLSQLQEAPPVDVDDSYPQALREALLHVASYMVALRRSHKKPERKPEPWENAKTFSDRAVVKLLNS